MDEKKSCIAKATEYFTKKSNPVNFVNPVKIILARQVYTKQQLRNIFLKKSNPVNLVNPVKIIFAHQVYIKTLFSA